MIIQRNTPRGSALGDWRGFGSPEVDLGHWDCVSGLNKPPGVELGEAAAELCARPWDLAVGTGTKAETGDREGAGSSVE